MKKSKQELAYESYKKERDILAKYAMRADAPKCEADYYGKMAGITEMRMSSLLRTQRDRQEKRSRNTTSDNE